MLYCLLKDGNLSNERYEMLLDVIVEHDLHLPSNLTKKWGTLFEKSSRYNVEVNPDNYYSHRVEKKS